MKTKELSLHSECIIFLVLMIAILGFSFTPIPDNNMNSENTSADFCFRFGNPEQNCTGRGLCDMQICLPANRAKPLGINEAIGMAEVIGKQLKCTIDKKHISKAMAKQMLDNNAPTEKGFLGYLKFDLSESVVNQLGLKGKVTVNANSLRVVDKKDVYQLNVSLYYE